MSNEQTHTERANIGVVGLAVMGPTSYDYDWPPAINWELDRLAQEVGSRGTNEIASDVFTTFHTDTLDVERLLKWFMVELLTLRAECSLVT